jgi:hypothetical protein
MANNKTYLVPHDMLDSSKAIYNKELLENIIRGKQLKVFSHDFSDIDEVYRKQKDELME